jgi:ADP-ribosylation factor related protein 1
MVVTRLNIVGKVNVHGSIINFWDLGGQKALRSIWSKYYDDAHAVVFVVDSTDKERIEECREALGFKFLIIEEMVKNDTINSIPVLMLANKQDAENAMNLEEIQTIFNKIAVTLEARDSKIFAVSALKGYLTTYSSAGVRNAVEWLYKRLRLNREDKPPVYVK